MTHHRVIRAELDHGIRPWSPRLGYALAAGGSAIVWAAVIAVAVLR